MIRIILSIVLIIIIIGFCWKYFIQTDSTKKVRFQEEVDKIIIPNNDEIKEEFQTRQSSQTEQNVQNAQNAQNVQNVQNALNDLNTKKYEKINPYNFYTQEYNTPNFTSNVMDLRKFYSYDNPPNDSLPKEDDSKDSIIQDVKSDPEWLAPNSLNYLEHKSNYWNYKNEIPMNGGDFGGIKGYETMGDDYSVFYVKDAVKEQIIKKNDDLRNGMGNPQKQGYRYDMSNT